MNNTFIQTVISIVLVSVSLAEENSNAFTATTEPILKSNAKQTSRSMILRAKAANKSFPELKADVPTGIGTRFAAIRQDGNRIALVVQVDQFYLEYREYILQNQIWIQTKQNKISKLNGTRMMRLAHVDILNWNEVEAWFSPLQGSVESNDWNLDLLNSKKGERKDFLIERYEIEATGNVKQEGGPFHSGVKAEPSALERKKENQ